MVGDFDRVEMEMTRIEVEEGREVVVWGVSDLHADEEDNAEIVERMVEEQRIRKEEGLTTGEGETAFDVLVVGGDVSRDLGVIEEVMGRLVSVFDAVVFVPGNNELRLSRRERKGKGKGGGEKTSVDKFHEVMEVVEGVGGIVGPVVVGRVLIVPLAGWHSAHFCNGAWFDGSLDYQRRFLDFRATRWPDEWDDVGSEGAPDAASAYFAELNRDRVDAAVAVVGEGGGGMAVESVVSVSHFLPRWDILPWMARMGMKKQTRLVIGDDRLEAQVRRVVAGARAGGREGVKFVHLSGHCHINHRSVVEGVEYVQNALGHGRERGGWFSTLGKGGEYVPVCLATVVA